MPVLLQHDREQRVGLATLVARDGQLHASGRLLSNPLAQSLAADADEGFPWQLSVHVEAGQVTPVAAGVAVAVNGRDLTGPLLLWRQARIRELSFTPTGVDDQTSARILSLLGAATAGTPPVATLHGRVSNPPLPFTTPETPPMTESSPPAGPAGALAGAPAGMSLAAPPAAPAGAPAGAPPAAPAAPDPTVVAAPVARLEAQLAAAETRLQAAEQALLLAQQARRQATVTQTFAALGLTPTADSLPHWLALADDALDALLADLRLAAERGAATQGLFAELAVAGAAPASDAALVERMSAL